MPDRRKTLIFGLDGFDLDRAVGMARNGRLPWLRKFLEDSSTISTYSPAFPGSEWVNAACGVDPSYHGYLHTQQLRPGTYEVMQTDAFVVSTEPFYVPLARAGHKVMVVDLSVDRPRPMKNLVQVIDWATEFKLYHYSTTPRSVRKFVDRVSPHHPLTRYGTTDPSEDYLAALNDRLQSGCTLKGRLIRALMDEHADWSVMFAGFCEIHKAGHFFWQYQDPCHPGFAGEAHPLAAALDMAYAHLDAQLAQVADKAGPDTNIVLLADRGMRANFRGDHLMAPLLQRLGYLPARNTTRNDSGEHASAGGGRPPGRRLRAGIKNVIPASMRPLGRRLLGIPQPNWLATQVFQIPDVGNSYLRVNLRGREPCGVVEPAAYDDLIDSLRETFLGLVNPATGRCPVREVLFPQKLFHGPLRGHLPDLSVIWDDVAPIEALESKAFGVLQGSVIEQRSGNHTERGGMIVGGPDFTGGSARAGDLRELAPTLLALYGIRAPLSYQFPALEECRISPG